MTAAGLVTVPGVTPVMQLGVADARIPVPHAGQWGISHWDSAVDAVWAGTEPLWLDVSCDVAGVETHTGRERLVDRWDTGTMTTTYNNSTGWADVLAAPSAPAVLGVRPGRQARFGVWFTGDPAPIWLWRGFVDAQFADYDGNLTATDVVTLEHVDALGEIGRARITELAAAVGAGETTTARIHRILDAAGWPASARSIDTTGAPMIATTLRGQVMDQLGATADSASGSVFADINNRIVFRHRGWQHWSPVVPADAVVGNVDSGAVCPTRVLIGFAREDVTTRGMANTTGVTTPPKVADDIAAQILYGIETSPERLDLMTDSATALDAVARTMIGANGVRSMPRISGMVFDAARPGVARLLAGADPTKPTRWRVHLVRGGRTVVDRSMFVVGVEHVLDGATWTATVHLDDADPWQTVGGRWDAAYWDSEAWATAIPALEQLLTALEAVPT